MAVARDDEAVDRLAPELLEGARHLRRGLAGADDDGPALRFFGEVGG